MGLTINTRIFADADIQGIWVRPLIGSYDLSIHLKLNVSAADCGVTDVTIHGFRVKVKSTKSGTSQEIGFATSDVPCTIKFRKTASDMNVTFGLTLHPNQLGALETLRSGGDLVFELRVAGEGTFEEHTQTIHDTLEKRVPRSDWVQSLKSANARNILLVEVPIPLGGQSKKWAGIAKSLVKAEDHFRLGHFHECVSACRNIVQDLGHKNFNKEDWSKAALDLLGSNRRNMTKNEREASIWGTIRHYTHQAHHSEGEGGEEIYSPAEARLILTLSAALVSHAQTA